MTSQTKTNGEKTMWMTMAKISGAIIIILVGVVQGFIWKHMDAQTVLNTEISDHLSSIDSTLHARVWKDSLFLRDYSDLNERVEDIEDAM